MSPRAFSLAATVFLALTVCSAARSQCTTVWSSGSPQPELTGSGKCSIPWDPDGAGPAPERLVIGGSDLRGGTDPLARRVMTWDGSTWQALGPGPGTNASGSVDALIIWNGSLIAGGTFTGGGVDRIALWNGSSWQAIGGGFPTAVTGLTVWNGELVAVGWTGGTLGTPVIQRWNGTAWTALPTPPMMQHAFAVTSFQGSLVVGGSRISTPPGGILERWNGTAWLPTITANSTITCFGVRSISLTLSTLYVGGLFTNIGGTAASRIASTSGGTAFSWQQVANGLPQQCAHLLVRAIPAGTAIVACLDGTPTSTPMQLVNGSFVPMGSTKLRSVSFYGVGYHGATNAATVACHRYESSAWWPVRGPGIAGEIQAMTTSGDDVIVGGTFQSISGVPMNRVARWNGTSFQPLGTGLGFDRFDALLGLRNGDILAAGFFELTGFSAVKRWDGSSWSPFGNAIGLTVTSLCETQSSYILAAGNLVLRWNGSTFLPLVTGAGINGDVLALAVRSDDTLFAGGDFTMADGTPCNRIAQWNGTSWLPVGTGFDAPVLGLTSRPNGDIVAVGAFTTAGGTAVDRCARWNGTAWVSMSAASGDSSSVRAVLALPNGDVIAGRGFHQPSASIDTGISRWNGSTWSGIGAGLTAATPSSPVVVRTIAVTQDGDVAFAGGFQVVAGALSQGLAMLTPTCPAAAQPYGTGCSTTAGPLLLATESRPWLGSTLHTETTGIAPGSLCLGVTGFTQLSIPLQSLLPEGQPGCTLLASPDIATLLPQTITGSAPTILPIPLSPSLVGAQLFQQSVILEFTGLLTLAALRSTNALALTIGSL